MIYNNVLIERLTDKTKTEEITWREVGGIKSHFSVDIGLHRISMWSYIVPYGMEEIAVRIDALVGNRFIADWKVSVGDKDNSRTENLYDLVNSQINGVDKAMASIISTLEDIPLTEKFPD